MKYFTKGALDMIQVTRISQIFLMTMALASVSAMADRGCGPVCTPVSCAPCDQSFQSGYYLGGFGTLQHVRDYYFAQTLGIGGNTEDTNRTYVHACSGSVGANIGYLHRFCETQCALGVEAFFKYSFVKSELHDDGISFGGSNGLKLHSLEETYSFGIQFRPGYVLCEDHMIYGVIGASFTGFESGLKGEVNTNFLDICKKYQAPGLIYGVGWEMEFDCRHRIRFQLTQTLHCETRETKLTSQGGLSHQMSRRGTDILIGYSFLF